MMESIVQAIITTFYVVNDLSFFLLRRLDRKGWIIRRHEECGASKTGDVSSQCPMNRVNHALGEDRRSMVVSIAFQLIMGPHYYSRGLLISRRTKTMQRAKVEIIRRMKARIAKNMTERQMHTNQPFQWDATANNSDLVEFTTSITHHVIRQLLDLPQDLDLHRIQALGDAAAFDQLAQEKGVLGCMLACLGLIRFAPKDSKLGDAQLYVKQFVDSAAWSKDSFCADVIAVGEEMGVDTRGVLAELMSGASRNVSKLLACLFWNAFQNEDLRDEISTDLRIACSESKALSDYHFVYGNSAGSKSVRRWVGWALQTYPNLQNAVRGSMNVVNLQKVAQNLNTDAYAFAGGAFGCPGQSLVRATMPLVIRHIFSENGPVCVSAISSLPVDDSVVQSIMPSLLEVHNESPLLPRQKPSKLQTHYNNLVGELEVNWKANVVPIAVSRRGDPCA